MFARGLAIALGKKLQLAGEEVWMRFFDSRLYDVQRAATGRSSRPRTCSASRASAGETRRASSRSSPPSSRSSATREQRDPVVHLITHAALHVPRQLVQEVRRQAHLFGVFILPSGGELDLEYLDLLEGHAVVDHATLQQKTRARGGGDEDRRRGGAGDGAAAEHRAAAVVGGCGEEG